MKLGVMSFPCSHLEGWVSPLFCHPLHDQTRWYRQSSSAASCSQFFLDAQMLAQQEEEEEEDEQEDHKCSVP